MLTASASLIGITLLLGGMLAILAMRAEGAAPPLSLVARHGVLAVAGYALLIFALQGPRRGASTGTQSFGEIAAILLALAALPGARMLMAHRRGGRLSGSLMGIHGMLAVSGFVILAAYVLAG